MNYVISPPDRPGVAVAGTKALFPVRRIFCVGQNYAEHVREMGSNPDREQPLFFTKPADAVVMDGATVPYPPKTQELHFEGELVVAIGKAGSNIDREKAYDHIWGYAIGNDLTRRDAQAVAKKMGRPWDMAKGFDHSAVIGPVHSVESVGHISTGFIRSSVNGEIRQDSNLSRMIWQIPDVISILSEQVQLHPGDLIMTGTPAGVGALVSNDLCVVEIEGLGSVSITIG